MSGLPDLSQVDDDAKHLANFLQAVLDKVVSTYASYGMPLPARRYWTLGEPSVDCEQLVVSFLQMYVGSPGDEATQPRRCADPRSATINISVSRQVPTVGQNGRPPSAETIEAGSRLSAYDAWVMMEGAAKFDAWEESGFGLGVIATVEVRTAEGGFQTAVLTMTAGVP
jgi:hypothetical protein